jgi:tRNA-modifying protein YgfZ
MSLRDVQAVQGAVFAPDGIPLHFGNQKAEYHAALNDAVLMDRSHEARLEITGKDRLEVMHRISTNDLHNMQPGEGRATIFINPNARILDRVTVYNLEDCALVLGEPGRGTALMQYLQRNIFFNDDARVSDLSATTRAFDLHTTTNAGLVVQLFGLASLTEASYLQASRTAFDDVGVYRAERKPLNQQGRSTIVVPNENAEQIWEQLTTSVGVQPAGSLTYNVLRIRAGMPGVGRELTQEYIPLEIGLWDEVSFSKGCYTGQEIIARMESRSRLANILTRLNLSAMVDAPAELFHDGHAAGKLTSSVVSPDGEIFAMGVIKVKFAQADQTLKVGQSNITAQVGEPLGAQPPFVQLETH